MVFYRMISPGRVDASIGITLQGYIVVLAQNRTRSHTMAQSFLRPVSTSIHFDMARIFLLSCLQFVVMVPAAKFTSFPAIVSTIVAH